MAAGGTPAALQQRVLAMLSCLFLEIPAVWNTTILISPRSFRSQALCKQRVLLALNLCWGF